MTTIQLKGLTRERHFMTPRVVFFSSMHVLCGVIAITAVANGLPSYVPGLGAVAFLLGALPTWCFLSDAVVRGRAPSERLTAATRLTVARGFLVSLVAGFVLVPRPTGLGAWLP